MGYEIKISEVADDDLASLPKFIADRVQRHLFAGLAEYATALSSPSRYPFPLQCQLSQCDFDYEDEHWDITILFRYSADENAILVLGIGHDRHPNGEGPVQPLDQ